MTSQELTVLAEQAEVELEVEVGVACVDCGAPFSAEAARDTSAGIPLNVALSATTEASPGKAIAVLAA